MMLNLFIIFFSMATSFSAKRLITQIPYSQLRLEHPEKSLSIYQKKSGPLVLSTKLKVTEIIKVEAKERAIVHTPFLNKTHYLLQIENIETHYSRIYTLKIFKNRPILKLVSNKAKLLSFSRKWAVIDEESNPKTITIIPLFKNQKKVMALNKSSSQKITKVTINGNFLFLLKEDREYQNYIFLKKLEHEKKEELEQNIGALPLHTQSVKFCSYKDGTLLFYKSVDNQNIWLSFNKEQKRFVRNQGINFQKTQNFTCHPLKSSLFLITKAKDPFGKVEHVFRRYNLTSKKIKRLSSPGKATALFFMGPTLYTELRGTIYSLWEWKR